MARRISFFRSNMLRLAGSILSAVMTALGVTSCGGTEVTSPCYGVPSVDFNVLGGTFTVRDSSAIGGIRITLSAVALSDTSVIDSSFTTESGFYGFNFIQEGDVDYNDYFLYIRADDVDSVLNGLFLSKDTLIPITPDSVMDGMVRIDGLNFYLQPDTT